MRTWTRRRGLSLLGAALASSVLGTLAGQAEADPTPGEGSAGPIPPQPTSISADVMVLHATNDNSGIDRTLGPMPVLSKPPFSAYNSYKLLSRTGAIALPRGVVAAPLKLPTGRELHVVYKNALPPVKEGGVGRYVIGASIETPSGKTTLPLLEVNARAGEWFWVGGQDYKGGALFIAIRINS